MSKLSYWERRKAERMVRDMDKAEKMSDNLDEIYNLANRHITSKVDGIFERFRQDHGLTEGEAKRILQNVDNLADFNQLRRAMDNATDSEELRQLAILLDSASYVSRMKRYESLQRQVANIKQPIFKAENEQIGEFYKDLAEDVYYQSTFDIQQQSGIGYNFDSISQDTISEVVNQRWLGKNYSERIWDNTTQLANELQKELAISLLTGRSYSETTDVINGRFNKGKTNARRLVRTESAHIHAEMEAKSYEEADIEYYRFLATLDLRTSSVCREHDGKVYKLSERQTGINYPPLHPWCRSDTIASLDEEWLKRIKRRARDPETGRNIEVPGDMTYEDWYDQYVKPKYNVDNLNKTKLKQDKEQYNSWKSLLDQENMPKSLDSFVRMKYNNVEKYNRLGDNAFVKKKIKIGKWGSKINPEKQLPHMESTHEDGKSYIYDDIDVQELLDKYSGTGIVERDRKGKRTNKEIVELEFPIGIAVSEFGSIETNVIKIHHSANRTHIVPKERR